MVVILTTKFLGLTVFHFTEKVTERKWEFWGMIRKWWWWFCDSVRIFPFSLILCIWNNSNPYPHLQNCSISWIHKFRWSPLWELGHWLEESGTLRTGPKALVWISMNPTTINPESWTSSPSRGNHSSMSQKSNCLLADTEFTSPELREHWLLSWPILPLIATRLMVRIRFQHS